MWAKSTHIYVYFLPDFRQCKCCLTKSEDTTIILYLPKSCMESWNRPVLHTSQSIHYVDEEVQFPLPFLSGQFSLPVSPEVIIEAKHHGWADYHL